jgi:hypothetical protein
MQYAKDVRATNTTGGSWYFYNLQAVEMGKQEFVRRWGARKLEDNWRRANKDSC